MSTIKRLLVGVGNPLRRDDGAGPAVIQRLIALGLPAGVVALEHHGEGLALLDAWQGYAEVTVIDATRSAGRPGTLRCIDVAGDGDRLPDVFNASSHWFGVAEAVALARALRRLPPRLMLYGIEGAEFGYGEDMSAPVRQAVTALARQLAELLVNSIGQQRDDAF